MRVYIAAPYTIGDRSENVRKAIEAATQVLDSGHEPFVPLLSHFWDLIYPRDWTEWMRLDMAWLPCAEALIRLPGYSEGADIEAHEARQNNIPVFKSVEAFLETHRGS